ncbi:GNAT family N-acetyltransferase [Sphingopyxis panaciterrae]
MIATERLVMRSWRDDDVAPFQAICSDPEVMATLGPPLDRAATEALIDRMRGIEAEHGHCFWALERQADARLIGWCGVIRGTTGPVDGKAEIGWRLARDAWGVGYATEAARGAIDWVFANLRDPDLWAITWRGNDRSRAVMERLGMRHRSDLDFDHPRLAAGDPLRPHVAYSLSRPAPETA